MLADRRKLLKAREQQVKLARRVIARHTPQAQGVSPAGLELIARFEGFVDHVYRDAVGVETIAFGETRHDIINAYRGKRISRSEGLRLLKQRVDRDYAPPVLALGLPTQNAIDATVSLAYNLGTGIVGRGHTVGDALHDKRWRAAADAFLLYDKAGGRALPGLTRRRQEERALFLKGL
jgi:lysozyme